ncbi:hypothetical protein E2562_009408 [Oryza meyeriana var. granulata]|uniref:Uncharacterized protein n=1 Tax=Oryza meyeriana var. granulata TaxID=110450 RepID=A0A6G1BTB0_9ORYZ|nr:hypothetical protein E2562_009408 [Oryza meyeriana var. granulata]
MASEILKHSEEEISGANLRVHGASPVLVRESTPGSKLDPSDSAPAQHEVKQPAQPDEEPPQQSAPIHFDPATTPTASADSSLQSSASHALDGDHATAVEATGGSSMDADDPPEQMPARLSYIFHLVISPVLWLINT